MSSHRVSLPLVLAILALTGFPSIAQAGKTTDSIIPFVDAGGGSGGAFNAVRDVAVNQASAASPQDGWIYVADSESHRVQAFDPGHDFLFAFGRDVVVPGGAGNVPINKQQLVAVDATGGTFTLTASGTGQQTPPIPFDAMAAQVQTALEETPTLAPGDVAVSGSSSGPWTVEFEGGYADTDAVGLSAPAAGKQLTGGAQTIAISTVRAGANALEICTVAAQCKQGLAGVRGGMFGSPEGLGIDQSTGHLYVRDTGNQRVQEFTATGTFVKAWGVDVNAPDGDAQFELCTAAESCLAGDSTGMAGGFQATGSTRATGVAVVPPGLANSGNVLVTDTANRRVLEFNPTAPTAAGVFVRGFGWNVDASGGGGAFEICTAATTCQAAAPGVEGFPAVLNGRFNDGYPRDVAVDSTGRAYVSNRHTLVQVGNFYSRIDRFDLTAATAAGMVAPGHMAPVITQGAEALEAFEVTADSDGAGPDFNRLFQAERKAPFRIAEYDLRVEPPTETTDSPHAVLGNALETRGLTVEVSNSDTGRIFATVINQGNRVFVFDDDGAGPPDVSIDDPTDIGVKEATFTATANPHGFPNTLAQFEVSSDGGTTWTAAGAPQTLPAVETDVPVSATVDGLTPATTYHARLKATKPFNAGSGASTPTNAFATLPLTPQATTLAPQNSGPHHVTLAGRVNPNGNPTTYYFEYTDAADFAVNGFTNAGRVPIPDGSLAAGGKDVEVAERVEGIPSATTYHYRLVATSSEGTDIGATVTATTTSSAFPVPAGRGYEMVTPPFKVTRSTANAGGAPGNNPNPAQPSTDGKALLWGIEFLPLTDEVGTPGWKDTNLLTRTPNGWTVRTINTGAFLPHLEPTFSRSQPKSGSADFSTVTWSTHAGLGAILETEGELDNRLYTRRDGTGTGGYTNWVDSPARQQAGWGLMSTGDGSNEAAVFNDAGTALARSGDYRGLGENPTTAADEDPSEQQLQGTGRTVYLQRVEDPDELPAAPKELVGECSGLLVLERQTIATGASGGTFALTLDGETTAPIAFDASGAAVRGALEALPGVEPGDVFVGGGGGAWTLAFAGFLAGMDLPPLVLDGGGLSGGSPTVQTLVNGEAAGSPTLLPARRGAGAPTDTIATQACGQAGDDFLATGEAVRSGGSNVLTAVDTASGTFAPGQLVAGPGIAGGTRIVAIAPGQMTLSQPVACGEAAGVVRQIREGSPMLVDVYDSCGEFLPGQEITAPGFPAGTTIVSIDRAAKTMTLSNPAAADTIDEPIRVDAPTVTQLTADTRHIVNLRGATLPERVETTLADTGNRVFFETQSSAATCSAETGEATDCPPQLFVREYDGEGEAEVRWISRSRSSALGENRWGGGAIPGQQIGQLGSGVRFEGSSRDGSIVYFATDAPLVPDDPNGGKPVVAGAASTASWDLYRYELPASTEDDPEEGSLTRVSGGPTGSADPSTSEAEAADAALRFLSDDGRRAYFLTTSPISGADATPPSGGGTSPTGVPGNETVRNLYVRDEVEGTPSYRFIASIPYADSDSLVANPDALNACASSGVAAGNGQIEFSTAGETEAMVAGPANCVSGSPDGRFLVFATEGQLTSEDADSASDIYLYDAVEDELVRASAPELPEVAPYECVNRPEAGYCNADLGPYYSNLASQGWGDLRYGNLAVDASGEPMVFFESRSRLVAEDSNGERFDVYQWKDGDLSLISPGNTEDDSWFSGNSLDGRDVFFTTTARIDPREIDDQDFDIYDARLGGGFPYTPPPTPCDVLAFGCEGEAAPAPAIPAPRTSSFVGTGNSQSKPPVRCRKGKVKRRGRCVTKKPQRVRNDGRRDGRRGR